MHPPQQSKKDTNNIELITLNDGETYTVENITEQEASTLRGVSATQNVTLSSGINYLKVTVTSANRQNTAVYVVKVNVVASSDATLHSLSIEGCSLNEVFSPSTTTYTCTTEETTLTPSYTTESHANAVVTGGSNMTNGINTITIAVTAEDTTTTETYTITVTKSRSVFSNADAGDYEDFSYRGSGEAITVRKAGTYKLEVWGAQGGDTYNASVVATYGGKGGYASGINV